MEGGEIGVGGGGGGGDEGEGERRTSAKLYQCVFSLLCLTSNRSIPSSLTPLITEWSCCLGHLGKVLL